MRFLSTLIASALGSLIAFGIIFVFLLLMLAAMIASGDSTPRVRAGTVLVVPFSGAIPEVQADDPFMQAFSSGPSYDLRALTRALDEAAGDDRIEALWLQMRSVPSSWATLTDVREALLRFKATGKPIYASADDYTMTESEYYLASTADSVFAAPGAMFEFNGFFITSAFFKRMLDRLDIEPEIVRAGRFKAATEPFDREDLSPENEEQLLALLMGQNEAFMSRVSESRGISADALQRQASENAIISVEGALEAGLIDRLAYRDEVVASLKALLDVDEDRNLRTIEMRRYVRTLPATSVRRGDGDVALVYATGTIQSGQSGSPFGGSDMVGSITFTEAMREARENDNIRAIVVRVNSPGGSASASEVMLREIQLAAKEKPVVISMGDLAASGGYWIATGGQDIVASPFTITGSIGVFAMLFDASGFLEDRIGVTFESVRTSPYADIFSGVRSLSPDERELLQGWVDETYRQFLIRVAAAREMSEEAVDAIGEGRIWIGSDALELGLVDQLGTLEDAIALAAERAGLEEGSYGTRVLPRPKTFLEQLSENLSTEVRTFVRRAAMPSAQREMFDTIEPVIRALEDVNRVQARMPFDIEIR
jgi:protease IV